jgi:hypothetical protein
LSSLQRIFNFELNKSGAGYLGRVAIVAVFVFLAGCERESSPQIVGEVRWLVVPPEGPPAQARTADTREKDAQKLGVPVEWLPPKDKEHSWFAIIIHHSATETGNQAYFNKAHSSRLDDSGEHWLGIGYDFVIGNGTLSADGQVETTFRWDQQLVGAHCKTADNWANTYGIGIVLVGNFNTSQPGEKQMDSLVRLVRFLQKRYDIPASDIYGHGSTPGTHPTDCPGRNFPMVAFKQQLSDSPISSDNKSPCDSNE